MTFEEYLESKKINSSIFFSDQPNDWNKWKEEFNQMHPKSFTFQKLFLINKLRRTYPLTNFS